MTQSQINKYFELQYLPSIRVKEAGLIDKPLRCMTYNDYLDSLHKDGLLTDRQVNNMVIPDKFLK